MNLDRRTFQIPEDHQHQFRVFLVHLKSLSAVLWMTFLSGANPPIRQQIPLDVSLCHFQRPTEPLAFQLLEGYQSHFPSPRYRIKPQVQGE